MTTQLTEQRWHQKIYLYVLYASYVVFGLALTGIVKIDPAYMSTLESILKYYVAIFLIIRFNPFTNPEHKTQRGKFDGQIAYTAGVFLLLTSAVMGVMKNYVGKIGNAVGVHLNTSAITM